MHRTQRTPLKLRKLIGLLPFWLLQSSTYYKHYMQQVLWVNLDRQFITSKERWSIKNLIQWLKWYFGHITPFILYWTCKGVELQFISHKKKKLSLQMSVPVKTHFRRHDLDCWKVYIFAKYLGHWRRIGPPLRSCLWTFKHSDCHSHEQKPICLCVWDFSGDLH